MRLEPFRVRVEAKRLGDEPVRFLHVRAAALVKRFVAEAYERAAIRKAQPIAKLFRFRRMEIERRKFHIEESDLLAVADFVQQNPLSILRKLGARQKHLHEHLDNLARNVVRVDMKFPGIKILVHQQRNPANHPDRAQYVVGMAMGDKHAAEPLQRHARAFQLPQNPVAAAGIGQKIFVVRRPKGKTGVITLGRHCRPRTEKDKLPHRRPSFGQYRKKEPLLHATALHPSFNS